MANRCQHLFEKIREAKEKRLKELDLSNDWNTDAKEKLTEIPAEVFELEWLEVFNLSFNELTTLPEAIARLQQLTSLNLIGNELTTLPEAIARLQQLTTLHLRDNRLTTLPEAIAHLQQLTSLDLRGNKLTTLPEAIAHLQQLTSLDLSFNELTTLPEAITHLQQLTSLNLRDSQLATLPEAIAHLQQLTSLNLRDNQLTTLPEVIAHLQQLTSLDLNGNKLTTLPEAIARLQQLITLDLSRNKLTTLPEAIARLQQLITLDLSRNRLTTLPEAITRLEQLTSLDLSRNRLTTLPEAITRLQQLTSLDLSFNQLTTLPEVIARLQQLTSLDLNGNKLTMLPEAITSLQQLTSLNLNYNPIEKPPQEVVEKGIKAIKDYLRQIQVEGTDYLCEAKLLIVGEGGAGKTTLAKKIENQNYKLREEDSTKGIEVIQWHFPMENRREFRVNVWDFGGQEIYHATHQFFLTKRSLYVLVADTRKEDTDFHYWLNVVELLSDNSPLLIIKNEKQNRHREINERELRGQFTNLKETLPTNLADNKGLEKVLEQIKHYIKNLPHIGNPLPKTWVRVREALESDARNYISLDEYLNICQQNGFTQRNYKLQLSSYLHDFGVCLHFQEDPLLNKTVILKPKWGTDAVYKVLDNEKVIRNLGSFTRSDLANIWCEDEYTTMHDELLRLMINFKLCYEIPRSQGKYIAPQLLSANQPSYDWNETNNLILRYTYEFMPKGIITQFIVAMHELINEQKCVWKSGVVLSKDQTKAEVIEYYSKREIKIRFSGHYKRDLMTIVTHELDKIHTLYKRLKYNKLIPCNCYNICKDSQEPHFYPFEILRQFVADNQEGIQCQKSYQMVKVSGLIDDVIKGGKERFFVEQLRVEPNPPQSPQISSNININLNQVQEQNQIRQKETKSMSTVNHQYGSGDNIGSDKVMRDKIGTQINNSQNLAQAAKDIKELLDELSQEYSNTAIVGVKAVEEIEQKPKLKARIINALKEAGSEALEKAVDHPAVSIVIAAAKGFMDT
ncbi:leucine-rich repeat domain-containing protein [Nostoc sp. CHAB 5784]|uniref:COR domain-containing protein n=1 Tax=Nostoc mirabile TaxID=2907820 RepID=UPI001E31BF93|nr:COR domain-containing protein [Nostoc mirabile]MCC5664324.1 leucine-rich repeat domain-containing protein [Nostoc mirabile CHAB5784]